MMRRINTYSAYIRQYGLKRCLFRLSHGLKRKCGLLKRKFPAWAWEDRPLQYWLDPSAPSDPAGYRRFRQRCEVRFFFPLGQPDHPQPQWAIRARQQADDLLAGKMRYFSRHVAEVGNPEVDWLKNPFTGQRSSAERHWCDQDTFSPLQGDIKYYWEPSRFCWVYALVRAYAVSGEDKYAETFWRMMESWMAANPPNMGPNWQCGQEISIRTMACVFALHAFWASPATTDQRVATLVAMLGGSAERIAGNINSARAQMGNHATSEAAGLYTVGVLFPELSGAARWRRLGRWVLEDEARHFNWSDGAYVQHSMNYHRVMLHAYLWCMRLGELNGERFSDQLIERMDSSWRFLYQLQDKDTGRMPNYGPNDGALILPLNDCDYLDYRPIINAMHYCLRRKRLYDSGPWDEDLLWLFGHDAVESAIVSMDYHSADFPEGGYYSLRGRTSWAMVRCHSYRSRPNQADMLHLDLWWKGINLLRDSGTFSYFDPQDRWHLYFVSTATHNTVVLGGVDQMIKGPRFRWYSLVRSRFIRHEASGPIEIWQGEHYGYRRLPSKATHRRTVCRLGDAYWLIIDDILGVGRETAQLYWHLPDAPFRQQDNTICLRTDGGEVRLLLWAGCDGANLRVDRGSDGKDRLGWQSLYYGERTPTPAACLTCEATLPIRFATLLSLDQPCFHAEYDLSSVIAWGRDNGAVLAKVELVSPQPGSDQVIRSVRFGDRPDWKVPS